MTSCMVQSVRINVKKTAFGNKEHTTDKKMGEKPPYDICEPWKSQSKISQIYALHVKTDYLLDTFCVCEYILQNTTIP